MHRFHRFAHPKPWGDASERVQLTLELLSDDAAAWARDHADAAVRVATMLSTAASWLPPVRLAEALTVRLDTIRMLGQTRALMALEVQS